MFNEELRARKAKVVSLLKSDDAAVRSLLTLPTSYRRWVWGCKKLIRLWARIEERHLFWPPLVSAVKQTCFLWLAVEESRYSKSNDQISNNHELVTELNRIVEFNSSSIYPTFEKVEIHRSKEKRLCSFSGRRLDLPAYVIATNSAGVVRKVSKAFGVKALEAHTENLNFIVNLLIKDFLKDDQYVIDNFNDRFSSEFSLA